jgi:hypothetical protein
MEIFALAMEVSQGKANSADPALLDEFNKAFQMKPQFVMAFSERRFCRTRIARPSAR